MNEQHNDVSVNLGKVRADIARAEADHGRQPGSALLVAVSKTMPLERIRPALLSGARVFGENRVQEAQQKWPALREEFKDISLHLIGPLQTNKVKEAVALFDVIQTLDREKLAGEIAKELARTGKPLTCFVQVNTGAEPQKAGVLPDDADSFIQRCRDIHNLTIAGLMCIPPADQPPSPHFALLGEIARRNHIALLSMGMSADFDAAIQLGATHVRIGSAIFGARH
ncbi:COG0325 Predicted enzyme with a TIM-barrel fold [Rhabdaerophilaceae bacterium]